MDAFIWQHLQNFEAVTGIRRCGKSYLLRNLFGNYLLSEGVPKITFYDALNDLKSLPNLDIYVTGSNSKMLSSDILTEFRGRSDEIRVHPLSFAEYDSAGGGDKQDAFDDFAFYGGMPLILSRPTDAAKMAYLKSLFSEVYLKDIVERKKIKREDVLSAIIDLLCLSIDSLTNLTKVAATINTMPKRSGENMVALNTVKAYMDHLADSFLFSECKRRDVKGKSYFDYPNKYYCEDIGLRNAPENKPFALTGDSFPKIIVRHDIRKRWYDEGGILNISVIDFLLDDKLV